MQDDGKRRHEPDTHKAAEEVIEREDRNAWILVHEPGKLYISEQSPRRGDSRMMPWPCVLLHALAPQEPCNRRSWRTRAFEYSASCAAKTRVSCPCFAISRSFANAS